MSSVPAPRAQLHLVDPRAPRSAAERVELVALTAHARRSFLLRAHRFRLRHEDLEDCYGQATLELIRQARAGASFANRRHLASVLEQRFLSRINDRRRALAGRSPMQAALEGAVALDADADACEERVIQLADWRAEPERVVLARHELRRVQALASTLSEDQRLVLAAQVAQLGCAEFCRHYGWSPEKYRKVAQRARTRLRQLLEREESAELLEPAGAAVPRVRARSEG